MTAEEVERLRQLWTRCKRDGLPSHEAYKKYDAARKELAKPKPVEPIEVHWETCKLHECPSCRLYARRLLGGSA